MHTEIDRNRTKEQCTRIYSKSGSQKNQKKLRAIVQYKPTLNDFSHFFVTDKRYRFSVFSIIVEHCNTPECAKDTQSELCYLWQQLHLFHFYSKFISRLSYEKRFFKSGCCAHRVNFISVNRCWVHEKMLETYTIAWTHVEISKQINVRNTE